MSVTGLNLTLQHHTMDSEKMGLSKTALLGLEAIKKAQKEPSAPIKPLSIKSGFELFLTRCKTFFTRLSQAISKIFIRADGAAISTPINTSQPEAKTPQVTCDQHVHAEVLQNPKTTPPAPGSIEAPTLPRENIELAPVKTTKEAYEDWQWSARTIVVPVKEVAEYIFDHGTLEEKGSLKKALIFWDFDNEAEKSGGLYRTNYETYPEELKTRIKSFGYKEIMKAKVSEMSLDAKACMRRAQETAQMKIASVDVKQSAALAAEKAKAAAHAGCKKVKDAYVARLQGLSSSKALEIMKASCTGFKGFSLKK